jgi:hypothetical protein
LRESGERGTIERQEDPEDTQADFVDPDEEEEEDYDDEEEDEEPCDCSSCREARGEYV